MSTKRFRNYFFHATIINLPKTGFAEFKQFVKIQSKMLSSMNFFNIDQIFANAEMIKKLEQDLY